MWTLWETIIAIWAFSVSFWINLPSLRLAQGRSNVSKTCPSPSYMKVGTATAPSRLWVRDRSQGLSLHWSLPGARVQASLEDPMRTIPSPSATTSWTTVSRDSATLNPRRPNLQALACTISITSTSNAWPRRRKTGSAISWGRSARSPRSARKASW